MFSLFDCRSEHQGKAQDRALSSSQGARSQASLVPLQAAGLSLPLSGVHKMKSHGDV